MKFVIFGLSVSSSWGNGHATLWRGLCRALASAGHEVVFFERDVPYYAQHRDITALPGGELLLYADWPSVLPSARAHLAAADAAIVTSYCPDALAATALLLEEPGVLRVFYDLDTGVTLDRLNRGEPVDYLGSRGLRDYQLVLSFTGGTALDALRDRLGGPRVAPLYGSVDPEVHFPVAPLEQFRADFSYLGTYAGDRQEQLEKLFLKPARRLPELRFRIGGSLYPPDFPWEPNIFYDRHVSPPMHPAFYCSSRLTLNITRAPMAESGYCPSGRLFEAATCGVPIVSDWWQGLDEFFEPDGEIVVARATEDAIAAVRLADAELAGMARAARARVLREHTAAHRAGELTALVERELRRLGREPGERRDEAQAVTAGYLGAPSANTLASPAEA